MLATLESAAIRRAVQTERSFLAALGGGCSAPVGAYAVDQDGKIDLRGIVASVDGKTNIRIAGSGQDPIELGKRLAEQALHQGAEALIRNV
jgi:hydroxymethylbilane synthase